MESTSIDFEAREDRAKMEKRIVRKMDVRIMPWIIVCKCCPCYQEKQRIAS